MRIYLAITLLLLFFVGRAQAQSTTCTALGQNPSTAFPVCGSSVFIQNSVPICGNRSIPAPTCNPVLTDKNPYWYSFTCFQSGTLGLTITPHNLGDDYDWQVFDVTGVDPSTVYTNVNLTICCNWSGESGVTGASAQGTQLFVCDGFGKPLWSKMPDIVQGHQYLLLVSHFTNTQSGYDLSFGGGTAVITDSIPPRFASATASCGGDKLRVKFSKKVRCSSIAGNGSDFFITPAGVNVTSLTAINCNSSFETDSMELTLGGALAPGIYTLNVHTGSDGNTVLDFCNNPQADTNKIDFRIYPLAPTPMDSIEPVLCKPGAIRLYFRTPVACNSVAADGSDFRVTGTYPVTVTGASTNCSNGFTREITVTFNSILYNQGSFQVVLQQGSDGNTIQDECAQQTPAGSSLPFSVQDTVNAQFSALKRYGCTVDTIYLSHPGGHNVNSWNWSLGNGQTSTLQNPVGFYNVFGIKNISLEVSNGFCKDSASVVIHLDNTLTVGFEGEQDICPNEPTKFLGQAQGIRLNYAWQFGDGTTGAGAAVSHAYLTPASTEEYIVRLTVTDSLGCTATAQKPVMVYTSCYLAVPNAFTPNNDGRNDYFRVLNAVKTRNLQFRVFNRWGQLVFYTQDWKQGWDGRFKGLPQPTDTYVWLLTYQDRDNGENRQQKGTVTLIR